MVLYSSTHSDYYLLNFILVRVISGSFYNKNIKFM